MHLVARRVHRFCSPGGHENVTTCTPRRQEIRTTDFPADSTMAGVRPLPEDGSELASPLGSPESISFIDRNKLKKKKREIVPRRREDRTDQLKTREEARRDEHGGDNGECRAYATDRPRVITRDRREGTVATKRKKNVETDRMRHARGVSRGATIGASARTRLRLGG